MTETIILLIIAIILLLYLLILGASLGAYFVAFGRRYDKNPLLKYFTAQDFSLTAKSVEVKRGKISLNGYIYRNERVSANGKLIIFVHGMGAGHLAYTTEIAYFCNNGFTVLALDSRGCNLSGGNCIKGMYAGVETAVAAIDFAHGDDSLKDLKICLVGHSWGGYSVLCASAQRKVEKVVAVSAPDTPVKTIYNGAAKVISKQLAFILQPFWYLINLFKFGKKGNSDAAKCAEENGTDTLLIHGDCDKVVSRKTAVYYRANGENITKYLAEGKAHNPYNTVEAEQKLAQLTANLSRAKNMTERERAEYFSSFDFSAATEEDEEVMRKIVSFLC